MILLKNELMKKWNDLLKMQLIIFWLKHQFSSFFFSFKRQRNYNWIVFLIEIKKTVGFRLRIVSSFWVWSILRPILTWIHLLSRKSEATQWSVDVFSLPIKWIKTCDVRSHTLYYIIIFISLPLSHCFSLFSHVLIYLIGTMYCHWLTKAILNIYVFCICSIIILFNSNNLCLSSFSFVSWSWLGKYNQSPYAKIVELNLSKQIQSITNV